jgi:hypothetical protein
MDLFERVAFLFTGALAGLGWSACWGSPPAAWGIFGMSLFGMMAGTIALVLIVRRFIQ